MKKRIIALLVAGIVAGLGVMPVTAAEMEQVMDSAASNEKMPNEEMPNEEMSNEEMPNEEMPNEEMPNEQDSNKQGSGEETSNEEVSNEETPNEEAAAIVIPKGNLVDVDVIDLSLHAETIGDFTPVYVYENPFKGKDTSKGAIIEFYANPTWEVHVLGTIFAINGSGEYDGKLYFTPGSYLGFNSAEFGGFFDANLFNYNIVTDYIKDGALIRIELMPEGFAVYADNVLCYDQTILNNPEAADGDFTADSDFSGVLTWLSGAEALYFGYGSWWNTVSDCANIELSHISFRLPDGTVLMDKLQADKDLVESLGGSVETTIAETQQTELKLADVNVEIFDIDSVMYEGSSVFPLMAAAMTVVVLGSLITIILVCRPRTYE